MIIEELGFVTPLNKNNGDEELRVANAGEQTPILTLLEDMSPVLIYIQENDVKTSF